MKNSGFAALVFGAVTSVALLVGPAAAAPGPDDYGAHAAIRNVVISPDGKHVAMITTLGDKDVLSILKVGGNVCRVGQGENKLRSVTWANSERVVASVSRAGEVSWAGEDTFGEYSGTFSISTTCGDVKPLKGAGIVGRTPDGKVVMPVPVFGTSSGKALLRRWSKHGGKWDLYKFDPATGIPESYEPASDSTLAFGWLLDDQGRPKVRVDYDFTLQRTMVYARVGDTRTWTPVYDGRTAPSSDDELSFEGLSDQPDIVYVTARTNGDKLALHEFNLATRQLGRMILSRPRVDVSGVASGGYSTSVKGAYYTEETLEVTYFDRRFQQMQADLQATYPGEYVQITSATKDLKAYVGYVEGATNPGGAYYYVETGSSITPIGTRYPSIKSADVGSVRFFEYKGRDGHSIPAYLTLPPGSSGKNLPLVVMPHGGPESRDFGGFDPWAQFLASRGYAVLQPQFRASTGFGTAHRNAGRKQWGLLVQDDITDGVNHMIGTGVADKSKVCIFGWSFGGYATLAGLAFTPDLYKCGVAGAGVSDLIKMLEWEHERMGRGQRDEDYFTKALGYTTKDSQRLSETSPARHAAKFKAPVLLIHGKDDTVVPKEQSDMMIEALKAAGKPYEYVVLDGEDHHLSRSSTSKEFMRHLERFLAKHLK